MNYNFKKMYSAFDAGAGDIAYDPGKLQELAQDVSNFYTKAAKAHSDINESINKIAASWEGQEAGEAIDELNSIRESLAAIEDNANSAKTLMINVANDFSEIHYN